jgi:uncharacterized protein (TIGR03067 family)
VELSHDVRIDLSSFEGKQTAYTTNFHTRLIEANVADPQGGAHLTLRFAPRGRTTKRLELATRLGDRVYTAKDRLQQIDEQLDKVSAEVISDTRGDLTWRTRDLSGVGATVRDGVDEILRRVQNSFDVLAVPLPEGEMKPGKRWQATRTLMLSLAPLLEDRATLDMTYTYRGLRTRGGQEEAVVSLSGFLREVNGRGFKITGDATGTVVLDRETGQTLSAYVVVETEMQLKLRTGTVRGHGTHEVRTKRTVAGAGSALRGGWEVVRKEVESKGFPAEAASATRWEFGPETVSLQGGRRAVALGYHEDETKTPARLDLLDADGTVIPAIYLLEGDTLMLCGQGTAGRRPTEFASRPDSGLWLLVLKRAR